MNTQTAENTKPFGEYLASLKTEQACLLADFAGVTHEFLQDLAKGVAGCPKRVAEALRRRAGHEFEFPPPRLRDYFDCLKEPERQALAANLGISRQYLRQLSREYYKCSPQLATQIEKKTDGEVLRASLRPDVFGT